MQGDQSARVVTDPKTTTRRREDLLSYYEHAVLGANGFVCRSAALCKGSVAHRPNVSFSEGQLSYLGEHYDTTVNGQPLRIVIVPLEFGGALRHVTMDAFGEVISMRRDQTFGQRNPHMRGVALALRLAFGLGLGTDRQGEYLRTPSAKVHVFDAYAMVNMVLCAAAKVGTSESRQNATMRRACSPHLAAALDVLEPTLVISQGAMLSRPLGQLFTTVERHTARVASCRLGSRNFVWVDLHHPARNWEALSRPYLSEQVVPSIKLARQLLVGTSD